MSQANCSFIRTIAIAALTLLCACTIEKKDEADGPPAPAPGVPADEAPGAKPNVASDEQRWATGMVAAGHEVNGTAMLSAVRTARHQDFERIVFEFEGAQLPNYKVEYVNRPLHACGSGETVDIAGDEVLEMRFDPAAAHDAGGQPTVTMVNRSITTGVPMVIELKLTCDFEAEVTWLAGLAAARRFRVLELKAPARLVVDVR